MVKIEIKGKKTKQNSQQTHEQKQKWLSTELSTNQKTVEIHATKVNSRKKKNGVRHVGILVVEVDVVQMNHRGLRRPKNKENSIHVVQVNN